jgi:hypothetical protein
MIDMMMMMMIEGCETSSCYILPCAILSFFHKEQENILP